MPLIIVTGSINVDALTWAHYDDLIINNGATVTVSTNQTKAWRRITLNNGTLFISNTSSVAPLRFMMSKPTGSGVTANSITPTSGLGIVRITGSWIDLGVGNGESTQSFTQPYTDFVPAVWVETYSGSNVFEPWINITSNVGESLPMFQEGLGFAGTGSCGKFFIQSTVSEPYPTSFTGSVTGSGGVMRSGFMNLYTSSIFFGDGDRNGNVVPSESRVRIPNILLTDTTPLNVNTASNSTSMNWIYNAGGVFRANTALFDETYANFSQAQTCEMIDCAWQGYPLISECYSLTLTNVAFSPYAIRRSFSGATGWMTRDARWGGTSPTSSCNWSYISNAQINNLYIATLGASDRFNAAPGLTTLTPSVLYINNSSNIVANNVRCFQLYRTKAFNYGMSLNYVNDSTFNGVELYGGDLFNIQNSSGNTFNAITCSQGFHGETHGFQSGWRRGIDPTTNTDLVPGTVYYFKLRTYKNWQDPTGSFSPSAYFYQTGSEFVDSIEQSAMYFTSSNQNFPDYFGIAVTSSAQGFVVGKQRPSASIVWQRREPQWVGRGTEIYRSTSSGDSIRDSRTLVTSSASTVVSFIDSGSFPYGLLQPDETYYYVLRKYHSTSSYVESPEYPVTMRLQATGSNYLLSPCNFETANWTKPGAGVVVTANTRLGPSDIPLSVGAQSFTADTLQFQSISSSITQSVGGLVATQPYMLSVYLASPTSSITMSLSASSPTGLFKTSSFWYINQTWTRAWLPFTASTGETTAIVGIWATGSTQPVPTKIFAWGAQVSSGSQLIPYISASATPQGLTSVISKEINSVRVWPYGGNGEGIELQFTADATLGPSVWWELHMSTTQNFVPTKKTLTANSWAIGGGKPIHIANSLRNTFNGVKQSFKNSGYGTNLLTLTSGSSNNNFWNWDLDYNYTATNLLDINSLANNNYFHNWKLGGFRDYVAANYPLITVNNAQGVLIQNMYADSSDSPISNQTLDTKLKNVMFGNARPPVAATQHFISGSTLDGVAVSYTAVYDTIFNEFTWNPPSGSIHLCFNASAKNPSPYQITGSLFFSNQGRLYFNETGSIEYTWPWKIYGISGFRDHHWTDAGGNGTGSGYQCETPFCNSVDLGFYSQSAYTILKEIAFKTSSVYSSFTELTGSNPDYMSRSFDPFQGFYMKIRLTSRPALQYDAKVGSFVLGEYITGSTSNANAKVIGDEFSTTQGVILLSEITGTFVDNEKISSSLAGRAFVNATGSVAFPRALLPVPTSYIDAMQWFTLVNTASLYPLSSPTLTLSGIQSGSQVDLLRDSDSVLLDEQLVSTSPTGSYVYVYDYFADTPITIVVQNLNYVYYSTTATLTQNNLTIPVQQTIDRNYYNPA